MGRIHCMYQDKILCDVVPMDACHLLLGKPYQYDRDVVHHGKKNMYTFKKDGVIYMLQLLVEEESDRKMESNVLLMSGKDFLSELKQEKEAIFSIIVKPKEEPVSQQVAMLQEVKKLLE